MAKDWKKPRKSGFEGKDVVVVVDDVVEAPTRAVGVRVERLQD